MRHLNDKVKLNRTAAHRSALWDNLCRALIEHEQIQTTEVKAKELRRIAERMVTAAKKNDLASRRRAFAVLRDETLVGKLFGELMPRFRAREGGYTRIVKVGRRLGDGAPMAIVEFVSAPSAKADAKSE